MQLLTQDQMSIVGGGDNPSMGAYVPGITQAQSNAIADLSFNTLLPVVAAGASYLGGLAFEAYTGVSLPSLTGVAGTTLGLSQGNSTGGIRSWFEDYTWNQFKILNQQNGFDPSGTTYQWPSGVYKGSDANEYVPGDVHAANPPAQVTESVPVEPAAPNFLAGDIVPNEFGGYDYDAVYYSGMQTEIDDGVWAWNYGWQG